MYRYYNEERSFDVLFYRPSSYLILLEKVLTEILIHVHVVVVEVVDESKKV